jgi:3'-phosphoadenosine 5'-phosphosulfate sulfotransferase (PAPS reductase)/FAD synthetase
MSHSKPDQVLALVRDPARAVPDGLYALPYAPGPDEIGVVPLSGGADSSATAVVMKRLFPNVPLLYCFWDTRAEPPETYESLNRIEAYLGQPIQRFTPEKGLMERIHAYNGFFPNHRARWCTRELKIQPFERWIQVLIGTSGRAHSFVGLRADEERVGLVSHHDRVVQHTPLKALGLAKADVFAVLEATVGIPEIYRHGRTRSGCSLCPFQSKRELLGLLERHPDVYAQGEELEAEKLSESDRVRWHQDALSVVHEAGVSRNHLSLPIPERADARTKHQSKPARWGRAVKTDQHGVVTDLFGRRRIVEVYALGEFLIHPGVGAHGVWRQNLVSWSRTRAGISRQAEMHWWHRLATAQSWGLSKERMREELHLAVYRLHLPAHVDVGAPDEGSFTLRDGSSYRQLRHAFGWIQRTLWVTGIEQEAAEYRNARPGSWAAEARQALDAARAAVGEPVGEVLGMDLYEAQADAPPEPDEREVTCLVCSL